MKKFVIFALLALAATGAFAQGFSVSLGGGGLFDWSLNNGVKEDLGGGDTLHGGEQVLNFGGYVFLDLTYFELDVGFAYGSRTVYAKTNFGGIKFSSSTNGGSYLQLVFSWLGKYPIKMGSVTFFPLLGGNFNMVLTWLYNGATVPGEHIKKLSHLGLLGGVGLDFDINGSLFIRVEALFHLAYPMAIYVDYANTDPDNISPTFGMGPRINVAIGYKF